LQIADCKLQIEKKQEAAEEEEETKAPNGKPIAAISARLAIGLPFGAVSVVFVVSFSVVVQFEIRNSRFAIARSY